MKVDRTFRDCADCHKRVLLEDGRATCEACMANRLTGELVAVDIALMMAGWDFRNTPAGAMVATLPRHAPAVEGDTYGMAREDFIDRLAAAARRAPPAEPIPDLLGELGIVRDPR